MIENRGRKSKLRLERMYRREESMPSSRPYGGCEGRRADVIDDDVAMHGLRVVEAIHASGVNRGDGDWCT